MKQRYMGQREENINNREEAVRLGWGERIGFGSGALGYTLLFGVIGTYMTIYMTNVAMLDIAVISAIIAVSKVFDGISDVVVGGIIDRTRSRYGRARVWMLRMCIPFAVSVLLLFFVPPHLPAIVKYIYVFLMYNLASTVFVTFLQMSHFSMISLVTSDRDEQGLLSIIQSLFMNVAALVGGAVFVKLLLVFTSDPGNQNTQRAYVITTALYCLVMIAVTLICVFSTKERVDVDALKETDENAGAGRDGSGPKESFRAMLSSRYWWIMIVDQLFLITASQLMVGSSAYFALYVLGDMGAMSWLLATQMAPSILILFIAPALMKRFGKVKVFTAGLLIFALGSAGFGLVIPSRPLMIALCIVKGCGAGFCNGLTLGIVADVVSYTRQKTGVFNAGVGNAGVSAANKLGQGVANITLGAFMSLAGFNAALKLQPEAVTRVLTASFCWIPAVIMFAAFLIFVFFFDLDKKIDEVNTY